MRRRSDKRERDAEAPADAGQEALLRKLSERTRGSGVGVVLTPAEMDALRELSSLARPGTSPPRRARRTRDIEISNEERAVLDDLAMEQARGKHGGRVTRPRRRTTEIEVTTAELEYLRRLSYDSDVAGPVAGIHERLQAAPAAPKRPVTLELTLAEAKWLAQATETRENALTDTEKKAVRALREKLESPGPGPRS